MPIVPEGGNKLPTIGNPSIMPIVPESGNKLPTIGNPSIMPIVPESGNKLPTIGNPSIMPIVPESGNSSQHRKSIIMPLSQRAATSSQQSEIHHNAIVPESGNKLPTIGNPSIMPIVPESGNKLPTIGIHQLCPLSQRAATSFQQSQSTTKPQVEPVEAGLSTSSPNISKRIRPTEYQPIPILPF